MLGLRLSPTVLNTFKNRNFASGKKADSFSWSAELRESAKIAEASSAGWLDNKRAFNVCALGKLDQAQKQQEAGRD